jgi:curved DNA-binding protein CbpA/L,D-peptidoglycan transpeptidase YkuD (ErfK/YbiS/YcfS/YnhG family)
MEEIMKDYYKILQVAPDASTEVIQMAYKALAKKYHPDLNPGQEEAAQEKMKDVNEAYEILSDKDKRWQYDQIYYRQEKTEQKTSYSAPEPPKGAQSHSAQSKGEQTSAAPVDPTPEDKEKVSSGKGCAKTGCGCLVVFVVLFILIGLFGGSSSDNDSDKKPSSSDTASVTATSEMSVAASETEEVKPEEELVYTLENLENASSTYNKSENPYYKDSVAQYAEAINIIYGENASQTVTEMTLEQALKDSDVSRLFVEKLLKLQGEDVMSDSDFYRMDVKTDSGIVKTLLTMESERQYMEVSSLPKDRIGDYEEISFYYGGMKDNKPNGNGALFAYSARNGLSLEYVGKFKDGKIDGKGISFTYDGLVHYLAHAGNYEKNMATGKMTTYYDNDCQAVGNFFLYKFWDYIDEMSEKWSEDELARQIDLLLPQKRVLKLIVTVNLYESPSTTVDFNQRVLIPHIKYEGEMKKGSIEGKGKLYASNGWLAYDGEWKKDKYNGKGILYNQDGTIRKKGTFDNEAPDEELIYSNLATASLLASDKISLEELFAVDDSDTSANTTQTATAENGNTATSIQSDAIPPEVSGCEKDGTWQKILVEATGSNATLTLWTYRDGQWEKDLSTTAAIGANGLTTDKTEGDHMTPEGTFPICFAFSTKEKNTMLYSKIIKEDSVWVCDPESIYYNTLQSKNDPYKDWADKGGAENMYPKFSKGSSNACICFGFNGDGLSAYSATPYAGSALFIDGVGENGNMNSGYGDIKISGKDMTKLLSYLCANDNPVITIKSAQ